MKRKLLALFTVVVLLTVGLGIGLSFAQEPAPLSSGVQGCIQIHTVARGETLSAIAARYEQSVTELWERNRSRVPNPDLIRTGAVLCISTVTSSVVPIEREFVLAFIAVDYRYTVGAGEEDVIIGIIGNRAGLISKRTVYPLAGVQTFANPEMLLAALQGQRPLFYALDGGAEGYALIQPGTEPFLSSFHSPCPAPLIERVDSGKVLSITMTFGLEGADGTGYSLSISQLGQRLGLGVTDECGSGLPVFALVADESGESYRFYTTAAPSSDTTAEEELLAFDNRLVLEARYRVETAVDAPLLPDQLRRLVFSLPSVTGVITAIQAVSDPARIRASLQETPAPLLYATRLDDTGNYQLVVVGNSALLGDLRPQPDAPFAPPAGCNVTSGELLSTSAYPLDEITAYLETESGVRYPFPIAKIGLDPADDIGLCPGPPVFALRPAAGDAHELVVLLTEEDFGPPGEGRSQNCARWRRGSGWRYALLQRMFGC